MTVPSASASLQPSRAFRARVDLPPEVTEPYVVFVNGIRQEPGRDYAVEGRSLLFDRELAREGRLGFWRWASMFLGIAGTYRRNDTVDVAYESGGRRLVAAALPLEPV